MHIIYFCITAWRRCEIVSRSQAHFPQPPTPAETGSAFTAITGRVLSFCYRRILPSASLVHKLFIKSIKGIMAPTITPAKMFYPYAAENVHLAVSRIKRSSMAAHREETVVISGGAGRSFGDLCAKPVRENREAALNDRIAAS
jgi:hypothetical protein